MGDGMTLLAGGGRIPCLKVTGMTDRVRIETERGETAHLALRLCGNLADSGGGETGRPSDSNSTTWTSNLERCENYVPGMVEKIEPPKEKKPANARELSETHDYNSPPNPMFLPFMPAGSDGQDGSMRHCRNLCNPDAFIGKKWRISLFLERFKVRPNAHAKTEPYKRFGLSYNVWIISGLSVVVSTTAEQFIRGTEFKGRLVTNGSTQVDVVVAK